jgi:hypothetical protein
MTEAILPKSDPRHIIYSDDDNEDDLTRDPTFFGGFSRNSASNRIKSAYVTGSSDRKLSR